MHMLEVGREGFQCPQNWDIEKDSTNFVDIGWLERRYLVAQLVDFERLLHVLMVMVRACD